MPLRWTENGAVIGRENKETCVEEYLGIPFARIKRFHRPEAYDEWEEPLKKGLFHRAIVQSGSLLSTWCPQTPSNRKLAVDKYCKELSLSSEEELKDALLKMTTKELIDFENKYMLGTRGNRFLIVVDDEIVLKDFYDFKNEIKMPLYYGRIKSEGEYLLTHRFPGFKNGEMSEEIFRKMVKGQIEVWEIDCDEDLLDRISDLYKETDESGETIWQKTFGRWYGDWLIGSGVFMTAQDASTFTFEFDVTPIWFHSDEHKGNCQIKPKWCESDHADDLPYLFGWVLGDKPGQGIKPTELDKKLSRAVIRDWSEFASGREPVCNQFTKWFDDVAIYTNQPRMRKIDNQKYEGKTALFREVFKKRIAKFNTSDY
ncbi:Oidioi.mRNA.OKI2018_I69.XSR.g14411.t2.cds [Oikopleura dioica]|uniref:Oidioi.mRNA.OKI2018_I69.XSR.g14411.t2.cds n=1 Tax=Oikopleura dioica TaxID=34765 RepID=A0ABN7S9P9_OIKDI|nr:Oidioi.mRNA.OKI2018_I69.XSR.g14411.t2.cds [Oikopleura dioica]